MKKFNHLLLVLVFIQFSIVLDAQLKVNSNGNSILGSNTTWSDYSLNIAGTGYNGSGGFICFGDNSITTRNVLIGEDITGDTDRLLLHGDNGIKFSTSESFQDIMFITESGKLGLGTTSPDYGKFQILSDGASDGICLNGYIGSSFRLFRNGDYGYLTRSGTTHRGIIMNSAGHIGINGTVESTYWLYVTGDCRADSWATYSDSAYKRDINNVDNIVGLNRLRPVSFRWDEEKYNQINDGIRSASNIDVDSSYLNSTELENRFDNRLHYGFLAQEVQNIYPDVVVEDDNGELAIDYNQFIPLLVQAYQNQRIVIDSISKVLEILQDKINDVSMLKGISTSDLNTDTNLRPTLFQNQPNPFNQSTAIKYDIPEIRSTAVINIYDMRGLQLKSFRIDNTGEGEITISASMLKAGMYVYNLIVDGVIVDTRQMVLTN